MNLLNRQWFYRGFRKKLRASLEKEAGNQIWNDAGQEFRHMLASQPELKRHKGAMVLPAVALYRVSQTMILTIQPALFTITNFGIFS